MNGLYVFHDQLHQLSTLLDWSNDLACGLIDLTMLGYVVTLQE